MSGFVDAYRVKMREEIATKKELISRGTLEKIEQYKGECGIKRGFEMALDLFDEVYRSYVEEDDDGL